jgi:TP901 family phage tail tape measure protein
MADEIQSNIRINVDTSGALESIKQLQNQISAFHTQMAKMGAANAAQAANMRQNLVNSINAGGQFAASITKIKTTTESFTESLEKNKLSLGEYFRYAGASSKSFGRFFATEFETINKVARERVKDLATQYIKLGRDANGAMQAIKVRPLVLDMESLATKTAISAQRQQLLNQLLKQGSTNLLNFGKNTQWAGRQLMVGFTIPLTIMGGAAMKAYQQIEEAGLRLRRVYGDFSTTAQETDKIVKQVQQLATEFTKYGVAVKDTMEMAATAAATGKKGADLLEQISNATKLSVLGQVDQAKALETTISLTNSFGIAAKDLKTNIDFLNAVENQTILNIEDMTTAIPKAAPVIQQLGGDVKDLAFFMTAMREGGINASEGANALKSGLASLINPTGKAAEMLQGFGINIKKIVEGNQGDLKKTVVDFAKALDTLDPLNRARAIEQLFGKFQFARMSTLFKNVVDQGSQAAEVLRLASQSSLELSMLSQRELNKIQSSPLYKFQKSVADFQAQLAPIGEQFMKAVTPIIEFGTNILKQFNGLGDGVKQFIVKVVAVAGVIGPVLLMTFGLIANGVANVIKGFALVKDLFNKTGKSSLTLGEQVSYMTQKQLEAAGVAASLDQTHSKLRQTFSLEADAVNRLTGAYRQAVAAQQALNVPIIPRTPAGPTRKYATGGIIRGPGTGTSDSILAMVSNGEAIIPAKSVAKNPYLVNQLISGNIPGFRQGLPGQVPTYGEYGIRLQNALENSRKMSSRIEDPAQILSFAALRIGEALGIKPTEGSVNKGLFDPIFKRYKDVFSKFTDKINSEFETTFASIKNTDERMRAARQSAAKFVEQEAMQLATSDAEKLALRRSLGLDPDFYGSMPTMPRRAGGKFLERARKSIYNLGDTGIRGYLSLRSGAKAMYQRMTGVSAGDMQLGHFGAPLYQDVEQLATNPKLSSAAKKALESIGVSIAKQAEQGVVEGVKKSTRQASPSKDAHNAGANIGKGAVQGIQSGVDDAQRAGAQVGQAVAAGARQQIVLPTQAANARRKTSRRVTGQENQAGGQTTMIYSNGQFEEGFSTIPPEYYKAKADEKRMQPVKDFKGNRFERNLFGKLFNKQYDATDADGNNIQLPFRDLDKDTQQQVTKARGQKIMNRGFGAGMALSMAGMFMPGPVGQIASGAGAILNIGALFGGPISKLSSMFLNSEKLMGFAIKGLTRFVPVVGGLVLAYEAYEALILPKLRKNADAYEGITESLNITKDKIDAVNNFFGTEGKIAGIQSAVLGAAGQTTKEATLSEQFMATDEFKNNYQQSAEKLKNLTNAEFKRAISALGAQLLGTGIGDEATKVIIQSIQKAANKTNVSIDFASFDFGKKTIQQFQSELGSTFAMYENNFKKKGLFDFEEQSKTKASIATVASYVQGLSAQFEQGIITGKEFNTNFDVLQQKFERLETTNPAQGVQLMKLALTELNPEIGKAVQYLNDFTSMANVFKAVAAGLTINADIITVLNEGTDAQVKAQNTAITNAINQATSLRKEQENVKKQIKGIQQETKDLGKLEDKINEKYDKRIKQIEKIKNLNEQISQSQEGQLDLAEALNKGDIGAAARAAQQIQTNDIQNALENQQQALQDARDAELKPLKDQQEGFQDSVDSLNTQLDKLGERISKITIEVVVDKKGLDALNKEQPFNYINSRYGKNAGGDANQKFVWDPVLRRYVPEKKAASGGYIVGAGHGTSDSIPAMLSNGEYVIRAAAVQRIGVNTLDKLNQADKLGFAAGGMVRGYDQGGPVDVNDKNSLDKYINRVSRLFKPLTRQDDPTWWDWTGGKQSAFNDTANYPGYYQWSAPSAVGGAFGKTKTGPSPYTWGDSPFQKYNPLNSPLTNKKIFGSIGEAFPNKKANQNPLDIIEAYSKILQGRRRLAENVYLPDLNKDTTIFTTKNPILYTIATYAKAFMNPRVYANSTGGRDLDKARALMALGKTSKMIPGWDGLDPFEFKNLVNSMHAEFGPAVTKTMLGQIGFGDRYNRLLNPPKGPSAKLDYARNYLGISGNIPKDSPIYDFAYNYMTNDYGNKNNWFDNSPNSFVMNPNLGTYKRLGFAMGGFAMPIPEPAPKQLAKGGLVACPCGRPGCPGCIAGGYSDGGLINLNKKDKKKKKKPYRMTLDDIAAGLSNPIIQGGAYGSDVLGGFGLAESYQNIFAGKGDFWDWFGAILAPFSLAGMGVGSTARLAGSAGRVGTSSRIGNAIKTAKATATAKKILATTGRDKLTAKQMADLSPTIGFNMREEGLWNFLKEGQYKTVRDGVRSSTSDTIEQREILEELMMGVPRTASSSEIPAYGFLTSRETVPHTMGTTYPGVNASTAPAQVLRDHALKMINPTATPKMYGDYTVITKPSVLARSTFSYGDTLSAYSGYNLLGLKVPKVSPFSSFFTRRGLAKQKNITEETIRKSRANMRNPYYNHPYIEAQTPGGFTTSEIEKIILNMDMSWANSGQKLQDSVGILRMLLNQAGLEHVPIEVNPGKQVVEDLVKQYGVTHYGALMEQGLIPIPSGIKMPNEFFTKLKGMPGMIGGKIKKGAKQAYRPTQKKIRDLQTMMLAKAYGFRTSFGNYNVDSLDNYPNIADFRNQLDKMKLGRGIKLQNIGVFSQNAGESNYLSSILNDADYEEFLEISASLFKRVKDKKSKTKGYFYEPAGTVRAGVYDRELFDVFLELNKKYRGKGIAQKFTTQIQELMGNLGAKKINIQASMTDGGYAWARAGFKYDEFPTHILSRMQKLAPFVKDPKFHEQLGILEAAKGVGASALSIDYPNIMAKNLLGFKTKIQDVVSPEDFAKVKNEFLTYANRQAGMTAETLYDKNVSLSEFLLRGSTWSGYKELKRNTAGKTLMQMIENYGKSQAMRPFTYNGSLFAIPRSTVFDTPKNSGKQKTIGKYADGGLAGYKNGGSTDKAMSNRWQAMGRAFGPMTPGQSFDLNNVPGLLREITKAYNLTPEEAYSLQEYVKRPYSALGNYFDYNKKNIGNAILRNKFTIDSETAISRVANWSDMQILKGMKPGQSAILDRYMSVFNENHPTSQSFLQDMISGSADTGGRSPNMPVIKFNVKTPIPGINDINHLFPGVSNVSDALLAPGSGMKLVKIRYDKKLGVPVYYIDIGTNIKAKYGFNQLDNIKRFKTSANLPAEHLSEKYRTLNQDWYREAKNKPMSDESGIIKYVKNQGGWSGRGAGGSGGASGGMLGSFGAIVSQMFATGGMVSPINVIRNGLTYPKFFANGGFAIGTDTVPAMLTPGEFVIKKSAVDRIGASTLEKINRFADGGLVGGSTSETSIGDSVYNYSINVSVSSQSDPSQIARVVMNEIKKIDNHRVRGSNF